MFESGYEFFARRLRRERRVLYFPWRITLALEGSQTSLRRESAEGRYKRGCLITSYIASVTLFRTRHAVSLRVSLVLSVLTTPVLASQWGLLPSRGTEAHSVLLLKASLAPCGRAGEGSVTFTLSLLRFHHTPSPFGYSPCLRGRKEDGNISSNFVPLS